ncbi:MAG: primosomal protein N', partial [Anaerolineae bacterium]|nr:primosomal protein N' [Anaerolineae bacterium]
ASYVFCRDCGYVATCPRCEMPLTYHAGSSRRPEAHLHCHHCGYRRGPIHPCPACGSKRIKHFGAGTEAVQAALGEQFPAARSIRWDRDTASHYEQHDVILTRFASREADVLIGTQMIAKGLDLPGVTLVGVLNADVGLALPDFRAGERTFQLLTQVVGRAGRALQPGHGIIQTYQPEHVAIRAASQHDDAAFYSHEIGNRRELGYPPFRRLARLLIRHTHASQAQRDATHAANLLQARVRELRLADTQVIGPTPCFFSKLEGHYRWHVIVRGADPAAPFRGMDLGKGWHLDIDPLEVL